MKKTIKEPHSLKVDICWQAGKGQHHSPVKRKPIPERSIEACIERDTSKLNKRTNHFFKWMLHSLVLKIIKFYSTLEKICKNFSTKSLIFVRGILRVGKTGKF